MSAERIEAILDGLRAGGKATDVLERHLALEAAVTDSPLVAGNRVVLLQDGPSTYRAMLAAIESSARKICCGT